MTNNQNKQPDLFGKARMGYALIESQKLKDWQRFTREALGLDVQAMDNSLVCRLDGHAQLGDLALDFFNPLGDGQGRKGVGVGLGHALLRCV